MTTRKRRPNGYWENYDFSKKTAQEIADEEGCTLCNVLLARKRYGQGQVWPEGKKGGSNKIPVPDDIDFDLPNEVICNMYGVSSATIRNWRKEAGLPERKAGGANKKVRPVPKGIDLTRPMRELMDDYWASDAIIRRWRKEMGLNISESNPKERGVAARRDPNSPPPAGMDLSRPTTILALEFNVSIYRIEMWKIKAELEKARKG